MPRCSGFPTTRPCSRDSPGVSPRAANSPCRCPPTSTTSPTASPTRSRGASPIAPRSPGGRAAACRWPPPEDYAVLLHALGFARQRVDLRVYAHLLASTADVVEWVKGTLLTPFAQRLGPDLYARFVGDYRDELLARAGDHRPYLYPFKRLLLWGAHGD